MERRSYFNFSDLNAVSIRELRYKWTPHNPLNSRRAVYRRFLMVF